VVVAIGDSNPAIPRWTSSLRAILQGCYGERGIGYHTFGARTPIPEARRIERSGALIARLLLRQFAFDANHYAPLRSRHAQPRMRCRRDRRP
jgi:hypothetical protein